ncbi:MAG TPA: octanoyltransferase [Candidatus Omnitrophica bacterium]|nr:MAG: lipoyl(octanoyl) transferase [Omnitrophica WOR_2 bacterium GWA2_53_43]HCI44812.1 octanoyltransferase [Candidatus Omnitrophota bacterium]
MLSNIEHQSVCEVRDLGLIDYTAAYGIQKECVARVLAGGAQVLFLCEHPAVITLGRLAQEANILDLEAISRQGIRVVPIDRGGDVTLHAPGQLVVYSILNLAQSNRDLRLYMHKLEQVTIALLKSFGIVANRISGKTGVFVGTDKLVSLGIGVRKWVTYHGLGINVNTDLKLFDLVKPCGLDVRMTSMARIKGEAVEMDEVKKRLVEYFRKEFNLVL